MSSGVKTMTNRAWKETIEKILDSDDFKFQIQDEGFYLSPDRRTFREYTDKDWGIISTTNTANFLSKDFWHHQSKTLTSRGFYLIRTGKGSFAIFDENKFPRPYLNLNISNNIIDLVIDEPAGFEQLKSAFRENILENTALEQPRFNGVYEKMIKTVIGVSEQYYVGIRGNTTKRFDLYFKSNDSEIKKIRTYTGQAELDYTLWTHDSVFLFEAKKASDEVISKYLDIGWHKFAFAAVRFIKYSGLKIFPVYFLRGDTKLFLFVFPEFKFHENGVILNEIPQMTPNYSFAINLQ
jgi:hypothetical protein